MAEIDIVNGCKQNRRQAQRALYDGYASHLLATAMRYMGNRDDAQDVLQEALIKAFGRIAQFEWQGDGSLGRWLERIVINTALSELRHNAHATPPQSVDVVSDQAQEPSAEQVADIDTATILAMVAQLPDGYRTVFNMYCIDGYSHQEIARQLGISESTSSSQLSRARAILARKVNEYLNHNRDE